MDHIFTRTGIILVSMAEVITLALFTSCGDATESVAQPASEENPLGDMDLDYADTNSVDSLANILKENPSINTDIIDSLLADSTVSKQEILDSIKSTVNNYIASSESAIPISSSGTGASSAEIQVTWSSTIETPWMSTESSSSGITEASTDPIPNNGIPYIRITVADTSALSDTSDALVGVYNECTFEMAGNGEYANVSPVKAKIRMRGNSTRLWYDKKPYRIKFYDKVSLAGLDANKDWVLLANYRDPTNYMNALTFDMARYMGTFDFVNANRFVEVEINGDYKGMYQLTEQIEKAASRVNITESGFLLSLDKDDGPELSPAETNNFWSEVYGMPVAVKYPKDPDETTLEAVKADFAKLEQAIADLDYETVKSLLDINSFIDFIIIQELTHNVELEAPRSMYLHKDAAGDKYVFGPVWDFDGGFAYTWDEDTKEYFSKQDWILSSGNPSKSPYNCKASEQDSWSLMCSTGSGSSGNPWGSGYGMGGSSWDGYGVGGFFTNLFANAEFLSAYKSRWAELSGGMLTNVFAKLDEYASKNAMAMENDANRWEWPSKRNNTGKNYTQAIADMKSWLSARAQSYSGIVNGY